MLYDIFKKKCHFLPTIHGWPFSGESSDSKKFLGGMCYSALDRFHKGIPINRKLNFPSKGSALWNEIESKQSIFENELLSNLYDWTVNYSFKQRKEKSMQALESIYPLTTPQMIILVHGTGIFNLWNFHPVIVHELDKFDITQRNNVLYWGFIYDPLSDYKSDYNERGGFVNDALFAIWEKDDNQKIGTFQRGEFYGLFLWPYHGDKIVERISGNAHYFSVDNEICVDPTTDKKFRGDTLHIELNSDCNFIPYYGLKINSEKAVLNLEDDSFYLQSEVNSFMSSPSVILQECYQIPALKKKTIFKVKKVIPSSYSGKTKILINFIDVDHAINLDIQHAMPVIKTAAYTIKPEYIEQWVSNEKCEIHGVKSNEVECVEDLTNEMDEQLLPEQTIFVSGPKPKWVSSETFEEKLFGGGFAAGYVKAEISIIMKKLHFLGQVNDLIEMSLVEKSENGETAIEQASINGVDLKEFCINKVFSDNNPDSCIKNGFNRDNYDGNHFIRMLFSSVDQAELACNRNIIFYAKTRLIYSGIIRPGTGELSRNIRDWILGPPYFDKAISIFERENVFGKNMEPEQINKKISDRIDKTLNALEKPKSKLSSSIIEKINSSKDSYLKDVSFHLLNRNKASLKEMNEAIKVFRNYHYNNLLDKISLTVVESSLPKKNIPVTKKRVNKTKKSR